MISLLSLLYPVTKYNQHISWLPSPSNPTGDRLGDPFGRPGPRSGTRPAPGTEGRPRRCRCQLAQRWCFFAGWGIDVWYVQQKSATNIVYLRLEIYLFFLQVFFWRTAIWETSSLLLKKGPFKVDLHSNGDFISFLYVYQRVIRCLQVFTSIYIYSR